MPELQHSNNADMTPLRPVFTPTVERTRDFSVKPLPAGLRYGNFGCVRTLPHVGRGHVAGQHFVPYFNNQQLFRKVWEWFESWTPWQQKMLLCGLTNRSSTAMLESLVTILEPVFHRDFATSLRGTDPSSLMGMPRRSTKPEPKQPKQTPSRLSRLSTLSSALSGMSSGKRKPTRSGQRSRLGDRPGSRVSQQRRHPSDGDTRSLGRDELEIKVHVEDVTGELTQEDTSAFTDTSSNLILTVTEAPDEEAGFSVDDMAAFAENLVADSLAEAGKEYATYKQTHMIEEFGNLTDALGNLVVQVSGAPQVTKEEDTQKSEIPRMTHRIKLLQEIAALDTWIPRKSAVETQHHNAWSSYGFQFVQTNMSLPAVHRHHSSFRGKQLRSADFFSTRPDMLQTELRSGPVKTPSRLTDIYVPAQKLYKNTHWFPERPQQGRVYVKPKRRSLKQQFGEQIKQIWKWMESWEDHERLTLLSEIVKLCNSEMINYLAQCLFHRLQERVDINWLPDRLLLCIFSYLPDKDIVTSAQVCRRWRYLCAVNELWMVKCHKLGNQKGITDLTDLVLKYNRVDQSIDWKLAYLELLRITDTVVESGRDKVTIIDAETLEEQRLRAKKNEEENVEDVPKKGTGHLLACVSERIKRGISLKVVIDDATVNSDTVSSFVPCHMTETSESSRSSLSSVLSSGRLTSLEPPKTDRPLLRRAVPVKGGDKSADKKSLCSAVETVIDYTENRIQSKPLTQWIRGQGSGNDEEDVALDVRPELQQATDILGKLDSNNELHWKTDFEDDTGSYDDRMKAAKFAGVVPGIKRVRKFEGGVRCLLVDKETLYSGSWDMTVMVWDVVHFLRKFILTGHLDSISCLKMNSDFLLSGSHDTTIRAWCRRSLQCMRVVSGHTSSVTCLSFDGTLVTSSGSDRTIRVTNLQTEECMAIITGLTETPQKTCRKYSTI
ncbi:hypothetical protein LSAT2_024735 [Lamellibrachia satsuma]|nr:hypothetical protein LSAT2_024735 [Lamellibrachia satsuma]